MNEMIRIPIACAKRLIVIYMISIHTTGMKQSLASIIHPALPK